MSNDILRNYEQQFGVLCADITSKISKSQYSQLNGSERANLISSIEGLFGDAREIIEQMELEVRDTSSAQRRTPESKDKYLNIISSYQKELSKLEQEFNKQVKSKKSLPSSVSAAATSLGGNEFEIQLNDNRDERDELNELRSQNQTSLLRQNNKLENGYKMVLESEETGKNILSDLFSQRETIERARDRLRESNNNLGKSSRIVGGMIRRALQNKLVLFGLVAFLILFVILVLYFFFKRKLGVWAQFQKNPRGGFVSTVIQANNSYIHSRDSCLLPMTWNNWATLILALTKSLNELHFS